MYVEEALQDVRTNPAPAPLRFYTLDALVGYLEWGQDASPIFDEDYPCQDAYVLHVVSPHRVDVVSQHSGDECKPRVRLACAEFEAHDPLGFRFNAWGSPEMLNIALRTCLVPDTGDIAELRKICASVRGAEEIATVKNPWRLAPWRTFPDVAQPVSYWVLRFRQRNGRLAAGLLETGNAVWVLEAVSSIADYLRQRLPAWTVLG